MRCKKRFSQSMGQHSKLKCLIGRNRANK
uniref:Uncharacterized protein n=1 Tax=Tetranychus urticae TaxID=32264 RepID=T1KGF7_TETUR